MAPRRFSCFFFLLQRENRPGEQVVDPFGDHGLADRAAPIKAFEDLADGTNAHRRIALHQKRPIRRKGLEIRPCQNPVKMQPVDFPPAARAVAVGPVAIQKQQRALRHRNFLPAGAPVAAAPRNIHHKETVVMGALHPVGAVAPVAAGAQGVEKHLFRLCAAGVKIRCRVPQHTRFRNIHGASRKKANFNNSFLFSVYHSLYFPSICLFIKKQERKIFQQTLRMTPPPARMVELP